MKTSRNKKNERDKENRRYSRDREGKRRNPKRKEGRSEGRQEHRNNHDDSKNSSVERHHGYEHERDRRRGGGSHVRSRSPSRSGSNKRRRGSHGRRCDVGVRGDPVTTEEHREQTSLSSDRGMRLFLTELVNSMAGNRADGNRFPVLGNVIPKYDPMNKGQTIHN